ncbi:hypothetical protein J2I47_04845 [Fibrella sp. HMF5335]|uniref:Tail specific protease domain-containing protein n=1 Tax=Fibrella rubiginis TaxID=2817060 RepID=A0A939GG81_9BACT|nr:S41 family peptidase [Fibrella rubiginis]MBO0935868.1 hypothetical protein [Fibrella rubiginis]
MNKLFFLVSVLLPALPVSAQTLTPTDRQQTIEATLTLLDREYVFPEVVGNIRQYIHSRLRTGYDTITNGQQLAGQLTRDLQTISHDKHLRVSYFDRGVPAEELWNKNPSPAQQARQRTFLRQWMLRENFGILNLSVLKGNLGYISFKVLAPPEFAGPSYMAAMNYLAQTDALIIDLRQCNGALSEHAIPLLCSYFFAQPTHLNDLYWRDGNKTIQSWTYAQVQGQHYGNKPIYVLTSSATFSGAEELAYDLKNLKRATLVGDTTGGGANGGGTLPINAHFAAFVPAGRAINPITKTNWENIGVAPDTLVAASRALYVAQRMALRNKLTDKSLDTNERDHLTRLVAELDRNAPHFVKHTFTLGGHARATSVQVAGSFNGWSTRATRLFRRGNEWIGEAEVEPGKVTYKFIVDGQWIIDPANPHTEGEGQFTNSVLAIAER